MNIHIDLSHFEFEKILQNDTEKDNIKTVPFSLHPAYEFTMQPPVNGVSMGMGIQKGISPTSSIFEDGGFACWSRSNNRFLRPFHGSHDIHFSRGSPSLNIDQSVCISSESTMESALCAFRLFNILFDDGFFT